MTSTAVSTTTTRPNEPAIAARATVRVEMPDGAALARLLAALACSAGSTAVTARTGSTRPCPVPGLVPPCAVASIRATTWAAFSPG